MMSLLEIRNINMNYHKKDGVTEALKNINFTGENDEFIRDKKYKYELS
jgi:ABC-type microcin C transport system duplicated ATPase subunit YejF